METETKFKSGSKTYNIKFIITEESTESVNVVPDTPNTLFGILSNIFNQKKPSNKINFENENEEKLKNMLDGVVEYIKNNDKTKLNKVFDIIGKVLKKNLSDEIIFAGEKTPEPEDEDNFFIGGLNKYIKIINKINDELKSSGLVPKKKLEEIEKEEKMRNNLILNLFTNEENCQNTKT